jgi:preprotein translocase subunit YajC
VCIRVHPWLFFIFSILGVTLSILTLLAQATTAATTAATSAPASQPLVPKPWWYPESPIVPMVIFAVVVYAVMMRSRKRQDKQKKDALGQLKRGDEIQTIGGIIGTVVEARETEVIVKVDETNNTKMKFSRNAIHRVLEPKTGKDVKDTK